MGFMAKARLTDNDCGGSESIGKIRARHASDLRSNPFNAKRAECGEDE
jgi:hypothetical protein